MDRKDNLSPFYRLLGVGDSASCTFKVLVPQVQVLIGILLRGSSLMGQKDGCSCSCALVGNGVFQTVEYHFL